jgi:hypothetical protein
MTDWSFDALWQKSKLYAQRAIEQDRDGPLFPLWASLALELLGRGKLAQIHPALLADPREPDNIMFAFGFESTTPPKSVPVKTVFRRCQRTIPDFTEKEFAIAMSLMDRRNEELHAGNPAFEDFPTRLWLADYFRIASIILSSLNLGLEDLFGAEEAVAAQRMIDEANTEALGDVMRAIAQARDAFSGLDEAEKDRRHQVQKGVLSRAGEDTKKVPCPACDCTALIEGELVRTREPRLEEDVIVQDILMLPTKLTCYCCSLSLYNYSNLHAAELGGQYEVRRYIDPSEYYGLTDPSEYFEEEYMNE